MQTLNEAEINEVGGGQVILPAGPYPIIEPIICPPPVKDIFLA